MIFTVSAFVLSCEQLNAINYIYSHTVVKSLGYSLYKGKWLTLYDIQSTNFRVCLFIYFNSQTSTMKNKSKFM